jgi:hypothetical protein
LATRLKVADPTAVTALSTLRGRLGLAEDIAGLSREEIFVMDVDAPPQIALGLVEDLVRSTNLFLNPNKHHYRLTLEGFPDSEADRAAYLLVWTPGEGEDLRDSLWRHARAVQVLAVFRAWLWRFTGGARTGADRLMKAVAQSAVQKSRRQGLLVHPAYQECRLYERSPSVYDTRQALAGGAPVPAAS